MNWLAAVIDTVNGRTEPKMFKLLTTHVTGESRTVMRVLNTQTGAVWAFTCDEERPPA